MNVTSYFLGLSESLYYGPSNTVREESGVMYWRLGDRSYQNQHSWLKTMATSWIEQHLYWSQFLSFFREHRNVTEICPSKIWCERLCLCWLVFYFFLSPRALRHYKLCFNSVKEETPFTLLVNVRENLKCDWLGSGLYLR
jgi:hypothetical protein